MCVMTLIFSVLYLLNHISVCTWLCSNLHETHRKSNVQAWQRARCRHHFVYRDISGFASFKVAQICKCSESYGGSSCSYRVNDTDSLKQGVWTPLYHQSSGVLPGRVGHSMFRRSDGNLVVFGGFSDEGAFLNDMWRWVSINITDTWTGSAYTHRHT